MSKRAVEELVARLRPQPPVPASVRRLPTASHTPTTPLALMPPRARPAVVAPLAPQRYKVQFTASAELYEKLQPRAQWLRGRTILWSAQPRGSEGGASISATTRSGPSVVRQVS